MSLRNNHIRKRHLPCRTLDTNLKFSRFQFVKKLRLVNAFLNVFRNVIMRDALHLTHSDAPLSEASASADAPDDTSYSPSRYPSTGLLRAVCCRKVNKIDLFRQHFIRVLFIKNKYKEKCSPQRAFFFMLITTRIYCCFFRLVTFSFEGCYFF